MPFERSGYVGPEGTRRTIEYKRMQCPIGELERPLVSRLIPFAFGCLNTRVNGTIYFGIGGLLYLQGVLSGRGPRLG